MTCLSFFLFFFCFSTKKMVLLCFTARQGISTFPLLKHFFFWTTLRFVRVSFSVYSNFVLSRLFRFFCSFTHVQNIENKLLHCYCFAYSILVFEHVAMLTITGTFCDCESHRQVQTTLVSMLHKGSSSWSTFFVFN